MGVLAFQCEIVDESNFYCVFGANGGFTFGDCNGGYCYICCCFVGLLKMTCILRKKFIYSVRISYGIGEAWNDMMISWSLSLVNEIVDKLWKWNTLFVRLST